MRVNSRARVSSPIPLASSGLDMAACRAASRCSEGASVAPVIVRGVGRASSVRSISSSPSGRLEPCGPRRESVSVKGDESSDDG
jgi:hypothetical protein